MANRVDPDKIVHENDSVDLDLDQTVANGNKCKLWSECWEWKTV